MELNVLIIFFIRPHCLAEVFKKVKSAKPKNLFLFCDGPRNDCDLKLIDKSKQIVSLIDWDCNVYHNYCDKNLGCGLGPVTAISWAFTKVDELIILEDDCVPSNSFFPFMKENLNKYKFDTRIGLISGFNHLMSTNYDENSYFFAKCGATLGWGTWKRVWDLYDFQVKDIDNKYICNNIFSSIYYKNAAKKRIKAWKKAKCDSINLNINYWDVQFGLLKYSQNLLVVVPKTNLIYNIGSGHGSTHTEHYKMKKWKIGMILYMPTIDLDFPLRHPHCVICNNEYDKKVYKIIYKNSIIKKIFKKIFRNVFHAN